MKKELLIALAVALLILAGCADQGAQNNASKTTTAKTAAAPAAAGNDFFVSYLKASSPTFTAGDRVTLYPVIENEGTAVTGVNVGIYANDGLVKMLTYDFKAGEKKSPLFEWYPDKPGKYTLKVVADPNNEFKEPDEQNNQKEIIVEIS